MSNLPSIKKIITVEETQSFNAASQVMAQSMGQTCNFLQDYINLSPVGSITQSMLTEAQYQTIKGVGWILCDGRNVAGSQYHTITGNVTVPTLTGRFIRGKKNGRADGNGDPVEQSLGTQEAPTNHLHYHPVTNKVNKVSKSAGFNCNDNSDWPDHDATFPSGVYKLNDTISGVDASYVSTTDACPKYSVVNYFVRIN